MLLESNNSDSYSLKNVSNQDLSINKTDYEQKKFNGEKVEDFRKQQEYGPKKFIKPWRTGTKSQQQYAPKGHKKGFRGKTVAARK